MRGKSVKPDISGVNQESPVHIAYNRTDEIYGSNGKIKQRTISHQLVPEGLRETTPESSREDTGLLATELSDLDRAELTKFAKAGFKHLLQAEVIHVKIQLDRMLGLNPLSPILVSSWNDTSEESRRRFIEDGELYKALDKFATSLDNLNELIILDPQKPSNFPIYYQECLTRYEILSKMGFIISKS
jgi:hypothetical protein